MSRMWDIPSRVFLLLVTPVSRLTLWFSVAPNAGMYAIAHVAESPKGWSLSGELRCVVEMCEA